MGRAEDPAVAAMWRERIERQQRIGLSTAAFCQKQDLAMGTFYAWKRRFQTVQQKPTAVAKVKAVPDRVPPRIHSDRFVQIPMLSDSPIEVRFTDGTTIRVPVRQLAVPLQTLNLSSKESPPMFCIPSSVRVLAYAQPTDIRKSFDSLAAIVINEFSKDPFNGDCFVCFTRPLDRCKILLWDRDGYVIWSKRLERGRFQRPLDVTSGPSIEIDTTTLNIILGGADLKTGQRRPRYQRLCEPSAQQTV